MYWYRNDKVALDLANDIFLYISHYAAQFLPWIYIFMVYIFVMNMNGNLRVCIIY